MGTHHETQAWPICDLADVSDTEAGFPVHARADVDLLLESEPADEGLGFGVCVCPGGGEVGDYLWRARGQCGIQSAEVTQDAPRRPHWKRGSHDRGRSILTANSWGFCDRLRFCQKDVNGNAQIKTKMGRVGCSTTRTGAMYIICLISRRMPGLERSSCSLRCSLSLSTGLWLQR